MPRLIFLRHKIPSKLFPRKLNICFSYYLQLINKSITLTHKSFDIIVGVHQSDHSDRMCLQVWKSRRCEFGLYLSASNLGNGWARPAGTAISFRALAVPPPARSHSSRKFFDIHLAEFLVNMQIKSYLYGYGIQGHFRKPQTKFGRSLTKFEFSLLGAIKP